MKYITAIFIVLVVVNFVRIMNMHIKNALDDSIRHKLIISFAISVLFVGGLALLAAGIYMIIRTI